MAVLVWDCPHCKGQKLGFSVVGEYQDKRDHSIRYVMGECAACHGPIVTKLRKLTGMPWRLTDFPGDLLNQRELTRHDVWPKSERLAAPENTPQKVAKNFVEAADSRARGLWNAACGMYRRTMEIALKDFAPDVDAWKLEKRIDKLAAEHRITPDIQTWAHELRLDGNKALHGDADASKEMTDQMHYLTHFLLVYLYSLPKQIQQVRERRQAT